MKQGKKKWILAGTAALICIGAIIVFGQLQSQSAHLSAEAKEADQEPAPKVEKETRKTNVKLLSGNTNVGNEEILKQPEAEDNWELRTKLLSSGTNQEENPEPAIVYGEDGKDGAPGINGRDGMNGERGEKGDRGDKGERGASGPAGEKGSVGPQGIQGIAGKDGLNGKDGISGKDGLNGKDGANGKSAYELAVEGGYTGSEEEYKSFFSTAPEKLSILDSSVQNLDEKVQEVFRSVSDGKSLLASTLTDKGISTAVDASFTDINNNMKELYAKGAADAISGLNIVYTYHVHTEECTHIHNNSCYVKCSGRCTDRWDASGKFVIGAECRVCGFTGGYSEWYGKNCPRDRLVCDKIYKCGKTDKTIESAMIEF